MNRRLFVVALLVAIPLLLVSQVAKADNVVANQWYSGQFGTVVPSPVYGPPYATATDGPVLPGGFADSIDAPTGDSWTITLTGSGTLTLTDLEYSGDQFEVYDNGSAVALATSPFTAAGQNPGQSGYISGGGSYTSTPCDYCVFDFDGINAALGNADFSSGTFELVSGVNVIAIDWVGGTVGNGDAAFIVEPSASPVPEPASLALFGTGLLGLLIAFRRKLMA